MSEQNEQPEPQPVARYVPRGIGPDISGKRPPVEMSFDPTSPEGAAKLILGTMEKLPSIKSQANKQLLVTDLLSHDARSFDPATGAESNFRRTVIYTVDGSAFDCGSIGVDKALAILSYVAGPPPWNPPISVTVTITELAGKRQWLTLLPDKAEIVKRLSPPTGGRGRKS